MSVLQASKPEAINECTMIDACARLFPSAQYFRFENFYYRFDYEADLFAISKSRYASEIEVKVTLSDWKADLAKKKHTDLKYLKYFYYAVPSELVGKEPEGIDPRYGIIEVYQGGDGDLYPRIHKQPQDLKLGKVPKSIIVKGFYRTYWRHLEMKHNYRRTLRELREIQNQQNSEQPSV